MTCLNCGKYTFNPKFCSRSCSATYNNRKFPKRKLDRLCNKEGCNEPVKSYRHRLCRAHHDEHKRSKYKELTLGEYRTKLSVKGKHPSWVNSHVRNFARSWNKELRELPCANCGYDKHVELCHRKAVTSFSDDTTLSVVNDRNNIIQLCRNCHWEFDNGLLFL